MNDYLITGIQQVGVGTSDFTSLWKWYADMFGVDIRVLEDSTVAERMLPYTGGVPQKRHACIALNLQGGGGFEIWQYADREPKKADFKVSVGDIGIFAAKLKSVDVVRSHTILSSKWEKVGPLVTAPDGSPAFFVEDPEGNMFQIVEDKPILINRGNTFGGMMGAMIGVTDVERSLKVYRDLLGYDTVVYDKSGVFDDMAYMQGGSSKYRRMLLKSSKPSEGAFARIFSHGYVELVQSLEREPRKIYEGRFWGDPGFIQICYDITGMREFEKRCVAMGFPFTADSCADDVKFDMGDASGHFTYIEDPDGTLIELVETYRIGLARKLGIYLDLLKRDRRKPLSKFLFRLMQFNKVKF